MIAFFGGTFDPFHLGHLHLAKEILKTPGIERFYFVPASQNPLKENNPSASNSDRLHMLEKALEEIQDPKVGIWKGELERQGKSYTLQTVNELKAQHPGMDLVMVLGSDAFQSIEKWFSPLEILNTVHCIIVERENNCGLNVSEILRNLHISISGETEKRITHSDNFRWIEKKNISALPFSSTEIRRNIKECWNKKELQTPPPGLQHSVWQVIKDNHLYAR